MTKKVPVLIFPKQDKHLKYLNYLTKKFVFVLVPNFAKTKSWHCNEINGAIYVWYHCDGIDPEWQIPKVEEIVTGRFTYKGRVEHHANTHIQVNSCGFIVYLGLQITRCRKNIRFCIFEDKVLLNKFWAKTFKHANLLKVLVFLWRKSYLNPIVKRYASFRHPVDKKVTSHA